MIEPNKMMANFRASDDRIAELKRERDDLAAQLAVVTEALERIAKSRLNDMNTLHPDGCPAVAAEALAKLKETP